jgi:hypothetical protein
MMKKIKSNPWMRSKALYVIPVAALALSAFATPKFIAPIESAVSETEREVTEISPNIQASASEKVTYSANAVWAESEVKKDSIYNVVAKNAEFPGGFEACYKWLAEHLRYPKLCQEFGVQGRVIISFVVEKDGSITDIKKERCPGSVLTEENVQTYKKEHPDSEEKIEAGQDLGELLYEEAERVMKLMPKWAPAKEKDGNIVRSRFNMPIVFRLN